MLAPTEPAPTPPPLPMDDSAVARFSSADPSGARNYYRARYYDPKVGRFLSEDPERWAVSLNFYPYVGSSPVNAVDPFGLQEIKCHGCDGKEEKARKAVKGFCKEAKSGECRKALERYGYLDCVESRCDDPEHPINVVCVPMNCPSGPGNIPCAGPCNALSDPTQAIFLQPNAFEHDACGPLQGTVAHEAAHMCGLGGDVGESAAAVVNRIRGENIDRACDGDPTR